MIDGKRIAVVLPAYNADKTLQATYDEIPKTVVDEIILVDDHSQDATAQLARSLKIETYIHEKTHVLFTGRHGAYPHDFHMPGKSILKTR